MNNDEDIYEDDLDILEIIDYGFPRMRYTRSDYFDEMDELSFYRRFRLRKETVLNLLILIENDLEYPSDINNSVSPMNQLLTALRFYATAGHLLSIADFSKMHVSTVSRIVVRVSEAIARLRPQYIKMPTTDDEKKAVENRFYEIARFPRVLGAVDGTHIKIERPTGEDGEIFRNRKNYFSINVQIIGSADLRILDIVARWPGSQHDATIFNNSRIRAHFENGDFGNQILLGDSGYPLRSYFFTPLLNPRTRAQQLYNEAHIRTRNSIERLFGTWKRRFPILAYGMRIKLDTVLTVIVATAVLQNIAVEMNEPEPPAPEHIQMHELQVLIENGQIPQVDVENDYLINNVRDNFINNYFAHL